MAGLGDPEGCLEEFVRDSMPLGHTDPEPQQHFLWRAGANFKGYGSAFCVYNFTHCLAELKGVAGI